METATRQFETPETEMLEALELATKTLDAAEVGFVIIGGIAVAAWSRPRWTHDIDILVRPQDAELALDTLADAGMRTEKTDMSWLFKAFHGEVMIDLIFRSYGDLYLDDDMLDRSTRRTFHGIEIPIISPEDLLIFKALVHDEHSPRHWHDALALIARCDLDWEYLLTRACHGRRRVLSLLFYAQSNDLSVPRAVVDDLLAQVRES